MVVLSFAKNKFPKFLYLSNSATPSASGIFHTKYESKETTTQKKAKNNNSSYQNKNRQLISKIRVLFTALKNKTEHYTPETRTNNTKRH